MKPATEKDPAMVYALRLLSIRMRSEKELRNKLAEKKYPLERVHALIDRLKQAKLIDDSKFVRAYIEELRGKSRGDVRIRFELKRKGIREKTIEECFDKENREAQTERALELARSKSRLFKDFGQKEKKRLYDFLVRRGFEFEVCREVIENLWE